MPEEIVHEEEWECMNQECKHPHTVKFTIREIEHLFGSGKKIYKCDECNSLHKITLEGVKFGRIYVPPRNEQRAGKQ